MLICATPAPIPRCRSRFRSRASCARLRRAAPAALRVRLAREAAGCGGAGSGGGRWWRRRRRRPSRGRTHKERVEAFIYAFFLARRMARRRRSFARQPSIRRTLEGPALVIEPHQTVVVEPGWSLEVYAAQRSRPRRAPAAPARAVSAPRPIRCCSRCSTTSSWRSPSRWAKPAQHRAVGQHQGAARLLLRRVRRHRRARRQRAASAGAPRLHGPLGRDDHPRARRRCARATSTC